MAEADALVREERERVKEKLRKQRTKLKKSGRIGGDDDDDDDLFEVGMWIEELNKNTRPYLIAQIIKAASDKKGRFYDLQYEDDPGIGNGSLSASLSTKALRRSSSSVPHTRGEALFTLVMRDLNLLTIVNRYVY